MGDTHETNRDIGQSRFADLDVPRSSGLIVDVTDGGYPVLNLTARGWIPAAGAGAGRQWRPSPADWIETLDRASPEPEVRRVGGRVPAGEGEIAADTDAIDE